MTSSMQDCMIPASSKEQQLESQSNVEDGAKYQRRCKEEAKPPDAAGSSVPVVMTHECGVVRSKGVRNKKYVQARAHKAVPWPATTNAL
jgi:hypothetical protein